MLNEKAAKGEPAILFDMEVVTNRRIVPCCDDPWAAMNAFRRLAEISCGNCGTVWLNIDMKA